MSRLVAAVVTDIMVVVIVVLFAAGLGRGFCIAAGRGAGLSGTAQNEMHERIGEIKKNATGSYDIYDRTGQRLGVGREDSAGNIQIYDTKGQRTGEIRRDRRRDRP